MEYKIDSEECLNDIIALEWEQFQGVRNEGGRASCQDDPETFGIMRRSQFLVWPEEIRQSYRKDLIAAQMKGRNLITEKYARMMASTDPESYRRIESILPVITEEHKRLVESIVACHIPWMIEHAAKYPALTGQGRYLFTDQDTMWETSSETYLRGELLTYSDRTLRLLAEFHDICRQEGRNLVDEQDEYMVRAYGYDGLEAAESAYSRP